MNDQTSAGKTGKGFYTALFLSIAMVGAAFWYAFAHSRHIRPQITEHSLTAQTTAATAVTTASQSTTTTAVWTAQSVPAAVTTDAAEEAAAILRHQSTETVTTTETAETTAPAERPVCPVEGSILQPFSGGELVKSGTTGIWQTHNGTDYAAPPGTEVCCVLDGTVTAISRDTLWGVCVTVLHDDGTVSRYCGLNEALSVTAGQILERGTVIGTVGSTAEAESLAEPHLHFEVMQNGVYLDPEAFLRQKS